MHITSTLPALVISTALLTAGAPAQPIAVRQSEGLVHGFLALRTLDGAQLATGDLVQVARGDVVTTQLIFHFKDGSLHHETAVYSQRGTFRLQSDHLVQKGPSFPDPIDFAIDVPGHHVVIHSWDHDGEEKIETKEMALPADLANGLIITLLKNLRPADLPATVSYLAAGSKPRLVKLVISAGATERFATAGTPRTASAYTIKVDIGGLTGVIAPLVGKQPPDNHVWILEGEAPAFVKSEAPLYTGGPIWRIELVSPSWPQAAKR